MPPLCAQAFVQWSGPSNSELDIGSGGLQQVSTRIDTPSVDSTSRAVKTTNENVYQAPRCISDAPSKICGKSDPVENLQPSPGRALPMFLHLSANFTK